MGMPRKPCCSSAYTMLRIRIQWNRTYRTPCTLGDSFHQSSFRLACMIRTRYYVFLILECQYTLQEDTFCGVHIRLERESQRRYQHRTQRTDNLSWHRPKRLRLGRWRMSNACDRNSSNRGRRKMSHQCTPHMSANAPHSQRTWIPVARQSRLRKVPMACKGFCLLRRCTSQMGKSRIPRQCLQILRKCVPVQRGMLTIQRRGSNRHRRDSMFLLCTSTSDAL